MDRDDIRKYFEDVCGYENIKQELIYLCDVMLAPEAYSRLGASLPRNIILCGEPGVGKTLLAECMARASGRPVFRCRKTSSEDDFIPVINEIFGKARESAPSIILLDDLDKFAGIFYDESPEFAAVQACIDDVHDDEVFVIATINNRDEMSESLIRPGRFDRYITVPVPDKESTLKIIEHYFSDMKNLSPDIDPKELADLAAGMTAVEIRTLANEAGVYAAYERSEVITMRHIVRAYVDRNDNTRRRSDEGMEIDRLIACHEAGHAVIAELLERGSVNLIFANEKASASSGLMNSTGNGQNIAPGSYRKRALISLGGRAATEVVFGRPDQGAGADLRNAYKSVYADVSRLCLYGLEYCEQKAAMEETEKRTNRRDRKIREVLGAYYEEALKMIRDNREFLDMLTEALLSKGYLFGKDISRIRSSIENRKVNDIRPAEAIGQPADHNEGELYA